MSTGAVAWKRSRPEIAATRSSTDGPTGGDFRAVPHGSATTLSMMAKPTAGAGAPPTIPAHTLCSTGLAEQPPQPAGTSKVIRTGKPGPRTCVPGATAPTSGGRDGRIVGDGLVVGTWPTPDVDPGRRSATPIAATAITATIAAAALA